MGKGRIAGTYPQEVSKRLNELLILTGKTKADVARDLGVLQGSLTPWFKGEYCPRPETFMKLGRSLDPGWGSEPTTRYIQDGVKPQKADAGLTNVDHKDPRHRFLDTIIQEIPPDLTPVERKQLLLKLFEAINIIHARMNDHVEQSAAARLSTEQTMEQYRDMFVHRLTQQIDRLGELEKRVNDAVRLARDEIHGLERRMDDNAHRLTECESSVDERLTAIDNRITKAIEQNSIRITTMNERNNVFVGGFLEWSIKLIELFRETPGVNEHDAQELRNRIAEYNGYFEAGKTKMANG